jgi:hypothetical protein
MMRDFHNDVLIAPPIPIQESLPRRLIALRNQIVNINLIRASFSRSSMPETQRHGFNKKLTEKDYHFE